MRQTVLMLVLALLSPSSLRAGLNNVVYFHEGFNGTTIPAGWNHARISGGIATWSVVAQGSNPTVNPKAGTGMARFNSFDAPIGEQARLTSPAIDLSSSTDPFLTIWMYHEDEYVSSFDSLNIEVSTTDSVSGPWVVLAGVRRPRMENAWIKEVISLYPLRGTPKVFLSLRGVSKYGNNIFVDEFRVADSSFHDIGATALLHNGTRFSGPNFPSEQSSRNAGLAEKDLRSDLTSLAPRAVVMNSLLTIGVMVRNYGTFDETSYSVSWRIDGQLQSPVAGGALAGRSGEDTLTLTWSAPIAGVHSITAWTSLLTDSTRTNDTTRLTIQVLDTATVFFESFNSGTFPPANWSVINRDGGTLSPWFRGADTSAFVSFEGSGFAGNNFQRANNLYLDDYLISPPIANIGQPGRVDSLVFWTRSINNPPPAINYPDSLMILLSTSGIDTADFSTTLDFFSVPKTGWTRKSYSLTGQVPTNSTVRIAFRYLLHDVGPTGPSGDFIGIDAVQVVRPLPLDVDDELQTPTAFSLDQNYPNPFNPTTTIRFTLGTTGRTSLRVYDMLGREVKTLVDERLTHGVHTVSWNADGAASGTYFYRLSVGSFVVTKKMLLIR